MEELLNEKEAQNLAKYINENFDGNHITFLVEVTPQSLSTDVKIGIIDDPNNYIKTIGNTSVIDWENYNW